MSLSWQASREQNVICCSVCAGNGSGQSPGRGQGGRRLSTRRGVRNEGRWTDIAFAHGNGERTAVTCAMVEGRCSRIEAKPGSTSIVHEQRSAAGVLDYGGRGLAEVRSSKPRGSGGVCGVKL